MHLLRTLWTGGLTTATTTPHSVTPLRTHPAFVSLRDACHCVPECLQCLRNSWPSLTFLGFLLNLRSKRGLISLTLPVREAIWEGWCLQGRPSATLRHSGLASLVRVRLWAKVLLIPTPESFPLPALLADSWSSPVPSEGFHTDWGPAG